MEFLYVFSLMFLSIFGLAMLIELALGAVFGDELRGGKALKPHKNRDKNSGR